jgi:hypothetical protein
MAYARAARVPLEVLIDDDAILPNRLPSNFNLARYKLKQCAQTPLMAATRKESKGMSCKINKTSAGSSISPFNIMRWVVGGV